MTSIADLPEARELAALFALPARAPEPGVYYDVQMREYLSWDAVSASMLEQVRRSPAHAKAYTEPEESIGDQSTLAQIVGIAAHAAVLEPAVFARSYVKGPAGNWSLKANRDEVAALRAQLPGVRVLKPWNYDAVLRARDAILAHPAAGRLLGEASACEVTVVWDDPETGLRCKARPDFLVPGWQTIGDLKSTVDASPKGFARQLANLGYHRKAAFYLDGLAAIGADPYEHFVFIAFEKEAPFATVAYELEPVAVEVARLECRQWMRVWAESAVAGMFPAYSEKFEMINLPDWY